MRNETIVDRVVERLKAQPLGDLITEEDLHDIVREAVPKVFFEQRREPDPRGYRDPITKEPLIIEVMRGLLETTAREAVKKYLEDNPQMIADYWKTVCDTNLLTYVNKIMDAQSTASVQTALRGWVDAINRERQNANMPPIYF